tara:strand:- start:71 stop:394 length:324 start_codon:yes stop_codon:yes gene_type:complete
VLDAGDTTVSNLLLSPRLGALILNGLDFSLSRESLLWMLSVIYLSRDFWALIAPPIEGLLLSTAFGDIDPFRDGAPYLLGHFVTLSIYYSLGESTADGTLSHSPLFA